MSKDVVHDDKELLKWCVSVVKHSSKRQRSVQQFFDHQLENIEQIRTLHDHRILS